MTSGKLASSNVQAFLEAGKATFTLKNERTGNRFTFKVAAPAASTAPKGSPVRFFVSVRTGADEHDYAYIGQVVGVRLVFVHGHKSRIGVDAQSVQAFAWFWPRRALLDTYPTIEVWHEGQCGRCGRALTVPESLERGLGPECVAKAAGGAA